MENIIITDLLTNNKYLDKIQYDFYGETGELMEKELIKLWGEETYNKINWVSLNLSGGYLTISDWESNYLRIFFLNNKIDINNFYNNLNHITEYQDYMEEDHSVNGYNLMDMGTARKFNRFLNQINIYKIGDK